jgi:hypothetical protein
MWLEEARARFSDEIATASATRHSRIFPGIFRGNLLPTRDALTTMKRAMEHENE